MALSPLSRLGLFAMAERPSSDRELVERARRGDVAAFGELFTAHQRRIYALCLRMTADPSRAEDLTQEAFVRAWQKLGSFRGRSRFLTWLHRVTVNVVLGDLRSRGRWEARLTDLEQPATEARAAVRRHPEAALDLERAIEELPPQARMVFVLHDVEGYRHREIAEMSGLAEGTSKAHLHRARRFLREVLKR